MVKKKISGQTIAILILSILLVLAIGFGGVYAFYSARTSKVSGNVYMATLNIEMVEAGSNKSEITLHSAVNVVPGQPLYNTPLKINNRSSEKIEVYIIVVYKIEAYIEFKSTKDGDMEKKTVLDRFKEPVFGLGYEYINSIDSSCNLNKNVVTDDWVDYVFDAPENPVGQFRVLVSMVSFEPTVFDDKGNAIDKQITVIEKDQLTLSGEMGNEYQGAHISFTFQAYAIGEASFKREITQETTKAQKAEIITRAIYESQDYKFLNVN